MRKKRFPQWKVQIHGVFGVNTKPALERHNSQWCRRILPQGLVCSLLAVVLLLGWLATPVYAEEVRLGDTVQLTMEDGNTIAGTLFDEDDNDYVIMTPRGIKVTLEKERVKVIEPYVLPTPVPYLGVGQDPSSLQPTPTPLSVRYFRTNERELQRLQEAYYSNSGWMQSNESKPAQAYVPKPATRELPVLIKNGFLAEWLEGSPKARLEGQTWQSIRQGELFDQSFGVSTLDAQIVLVAQADDLNKSFPRVMLNANSSIWFHREYLTVSAGKAWLRADSDQGVLVQMNNSWFLLEQGWAAVEKLRTGYAVSLTEGKGTIFRGPLVDPILEMKNGQTALIDAAGFVSQSSLSDALQQEAKQWRSRLESQGLKQ